jgi:hypothetical protein
MRRLANERQGNVDIAQIVQGWIVDGLKGLLFAGIQLAFAWYFVKRYEKSREQKALGILGFQLAQLLYWIWFFQEAGKEVRTKLNENDQDLNPWIRDCIFSFQDKPRDAAHAKALRSAKTAKDILVTLGDLPYELTEWKWKADRLDGIINTVYLLLPTIDARISAAILEPLSALQVVANDAAWQMDLAIKASERLRFMALVGKEPITDHERETIRGSINAGVIVTWRQMYLNTARVWDEVQAALRSYPAAVKDAHDMVLSHLTAGMKDRPPLASESAGPRLEPRDE